MKAKILKFDPLSRKNLKSGYQYHELFGKSQAMQQVFQLINTVSNTESTILISGETGTGKELVANAIHSSSRRRDGPLIKLNCAVLNHEVLESELFGHEQGAFTGATRRRRGRFELADEGTIFLDDVDDIPPSIQVKLLRVIEQKTFERVGGEETIKVDVRIICATKRDIRKMVSEGIFREDLFYRLNIIQIELPALRARREDIPLLTEVFLKKTSTINCKTVESISPKAQEILCEYDWPGNVRELENVIERAIALCNSELVTPQDLPGYLTDNGEYEQIIRLDLNGQEKVDLRGILKEVECSLIKWAMQKAGGVQVRAANILCIKQPAMHRRLKQL